MIDASPVPQTASHHAGREGRLTDQIVSRRAIGSDGNSGNPVELVRLRDGRRLVLKRVSPDWDWMARETHDDGRIRLLWQSGVLDRLPRAIDHTVVAVEADGDVSNVFMRDVSASLTRPHERLCRASVRRILGAAADVHRAFWGERIDGLCSLDDRYTLFSPATGRRELARGSHHGEVFTRGWDAFFELADADVAAAVSAVLEHPHLLAKEMSSCAQTLVHGDLRLGNIGFDDERVVIIDWGERVGVAPPAVDLAWFLGFDALRLGVSKDDVIDDFRALYGERFEERGLLLSLIGGLVQLGGLLGFWIIAEEEDQVRAARRDELAWWCVRVGGALDTWSPV